MKGININKRGNSNRAERQRADRQGKFLKRGRSKEGRKLTKTWDRGISTNEGSKKREIKPRTATPGRTGLRDKDKCKVLHQDQGNTSRLGGEGIEMS